MIRDWAKRFLPVIDNGVLVGIVTRINILNLTSTKSNLKVSDIMDEPPLLLTPDDDVIEATKTMIKLDEWYAGVVKSKQDMGYLGVYSLEEFIKYYSRMGLKVLSEPVSKFMTSNVISLSPEEAVSSIWHKMLKYKYAGFPVVRKNGEVIGVVTQHDLIRYGFTRILRESERSKVIKLVEAREIMTTPPVTVFESDKLSKVAMLMIERDIGRVIVVDFSYRLKGIIDREDLARAYLGELTGKVI